MMPNQRARAFATRLTRAALAGAILAAFIGSATAQTGTFLDRDRASDLRVVSYNVLWDRIFPDAYPVQAAKFERVMHALDADIINLQEINGSSADVVDLMNSIMPLPDNGQWYAHKGRDNVIVSKYPLSMQLGNTSPGSPRGIAIALVDLPDGDFSHDFYFMNNHYRCCGDPGGSEDAERQQQSDALVNWMRDARTPGGSVDLAADTPMAVVGDLNMVGSLDPLNNLLDGNIVDEGTYGADSPPDWDGTSLADSHPLHNVTGNDDYTWRNDASQYDPGRLDFVLYTDSVVGVPKSFVLNTVDMTAADRSATGLQTFDITVDLVGSTYDHLPLVVDFRFPSSIPGDYNSDGMVDALDYDDWKAAFGTTNSAADGNGNGIVDAADYTFWRDRLVVGAGVAASVAAAEVPEPTCIALFAVAAACIISGRCPRYTRAAGDS